MKRIRYLHCSSFLGLDNHVDSRLHSGTPLHNRRIKEKQIVKEEGERRENETIEEYEQWKQGKDLD